MSSSYHLGIDVQNRIAHRLAISSALKHALSCLGTPLEERVIEVWMLPPM